jgi:ribonuclease J
MLKFLAPCGDPIFIHTSGHASPELLVKLAQSIKPKVLVPIHGQCWDNHYFEFENICPLANGQWLEF